jgi:hypothetical protein
MIQKNQDRSLLNHLRNEITSLILALSQKTSSWCSDDALVVYPSLFHSTNDDSSESGYSSNQLSSSTNVTADSDWQFRGKKRVRTSSGQSISDTVSQSTVDQSASNTVSQSTADQLRLDSNYITDSVSQDSNDQDSNHGNVKENESEEDCMEICKLEASGSENQQFKGQFRIWFAANFSNSENLPHSNTTVCKGCGYDKNGKRYKTSEGLTRLIHGTVTKRNKW